MTRLTATLVLVALALAAIHLLLVPVSHGADRAMLPDLLFVLVATWSMLRPDTLPLGLVVALGLAADVLLGRPPGLGALGLVVASEALRGRRGGFFYGWAAVAVLFALVTAASTALLTITFLPAPGLEILAGHWLATVAAYPAIAFLARGALRLGTAP